MNTVGISNKFIGDNNPSFIIAEAGVNHNGLLSNAIKLIEIAADAGADAVKFQTFNTEYLTIPNAPKAEYQIKATKKKESQSEMLKELELTAEEFATLYKVAKEKNIIFLSTPFDYLSVDILNKIGVSAFKIPSGEITNLPLIKYISRLQKPIILSTGMSLLEEVKDSVESIYKTGNQNIVLMHCVSNYPTEPIDVNLLAMQTMKDTFQVPVGFSDHTIGIEIPIAAIALKADLIEKHFTLNKQMPGPDHKSSLNPFELKKMIKSIRNVEKSFGDGIKRPKKSENNIRHIARRSIYSQKVLPKNHSIKETDLVCLRPGGGLTPSQIPYLINKKTNRKIPAYTLLKKSDTK